MSNTPTPENAKTTPCDILTVMFDGACPLCRREVGLYRGIKPLQPLRWLDVSAETNLLDKAEDRSLLLARFHVRRANGELLSGAQAFVALWLQLPGWRWMGRAASLPGATAFLELLYVGFLRIRPRLQTLVRGLESRKH